MFMPFPSIDGSTVAQGVSPWYWQVIPYVFSDGVVRH